VVPKLPFREKLLNQILANNYPTDKYTMLQSGAHERNFCAG
jgi:hypothetical protein